MTISEEFEKGAGYNAQSTPSVLKGALEARIILLQLQSKYWEELTEQLQIMGIYAKGKSAKEVSQLLYNYAEKELSPYKPYIKIDDDGNLTDDHGKAIARNNAPRDHGYLRTILYWMVSSPWSERDQKLAEDQTKAVWLPEDWPKIRDNLALYNKLKERQNITDIQRNIREIKSPSELEQQVSKYQTINARANRLMDQADAVFSQKIDEAEVIFTSSEKVADTNGIERPRLRIIHVKTEAATRAYGRDTRWCTAYQDKPTYFSNYSQGLLIFHTSGGVRAQLYFGNGNVQFKDELDKDTTLPKLGLSDVLDLAFFIQDEDKDYSRFILMLPLLKECTKASQEVDAYFVQSPDGDFSQVARAIFSFKSEGTGFVRSQIEVIAKRLEILDNFKGLMENQSFDVEFYGMYHGEMRKWGKELTSKEAFPMVSEYSKLGGEESFLKECLKELIYSRAHLALDGFFSRKPSDNVIDFIDMVMNDQVFRSKVLVSMPRVVAKLSISEFSQNIPSALEAFKQNREVYGVLRSSILFAAPTFIERICEENLWDSLADLSKNMVSADLEVISSLEDVVSQTLESLLPTSINKMISEKNYHGIQNLVSVLEMNSKYAEAFNTLPISVKKSLLAHSASEDTSSLLRGTLKSSFEEKSEPANIAGKESKAGIGEIFGLVAQSAKRIFKFIGIIKDKPNDNSPSP